MHFRPVYANELDLFVEATPANNHEEIGRYLESMFAAGSMRPEWCFVAQNRGRTVGRVALWTLPGMDEPLALVLLDVPWEGEYLDVGAYLLGNVLDEARRLGAREIEHVLDDPPMRPQFQHSPEKRVELLGDFGFALRRETYRYEWPEGETPPVANRLFFRSLESVGEEAFVDAMIKASEGTLDREIQEERVRLGPREAAQDFFDDARRVEHDPAWWRLAYAPNGELVGLVMPAAPPAFLTLFYVAVVPEMRGRGYVNELLAAGTTTLLEARTSSETPLRTDTDVANRPMAAAFERAGWVRFGKRREYAVDLGTRN
jgi:RimJ/RimL family protein N-acetyltransferase/predicted N-acetyltransferase YhbS